MSKFEEQIIETVKSFLINGISTYDRYKNPLYDLMEGIIKERSDEIGKVVRDALSDVLTGDFKAEVRKIVAQKVVREIGNQSESIIARTIQKLKQDETFKARLTLFVDNLLKEYEGKNNE